MTKPDRLRRLSVCATHSPCVIALALVLVAASHAGLVEASPPGSEDVAEGAHSEQAVTLCESSHWGRAYRAGCVDMCTLVTMPSLEGSEVDAEAAFAAARERCGEHCYEFCTAQVDRLEQARKAAPEEEAPASEPEPDPDGG